VIDVPTRPAGDVLGRVVRVRLGGQEYVLPVRSIRANREWKAQLDALTAAKVEAVTLVEGDSVSQLEQILSILDHDDIDKLIDLLLSYDTAGVLPSREAIEDLEPDASLDVMSACREVWRAASPLVDTVLGAMERTLRPTGSMPTSSPRPSTAGRRKRSTAN
jgi:hypothetical protein